MTIEDGDIKSAIAEIFSGEERIGGRDLLLGNDQSVKQARILQHILDAPSGIFSQAWNKVEQGVEGQGGDVVFGQCGTSRHPPLRARRTHLWLSLFQLVKFFEILDLLPLAADSRAQFALLALRGVDGPRQIVF